MQGDLTAKIGDRYITNFFIGDKECQLDVYHACRRDSKERSRLIDELITDKTSDLRALGIVGDHISDNDLKWWLVVYALDYVIDCLDGYNCKWPLVRENGETWGVIGYEDVELPEKIMLGHNGMQGNGSNSNFWAYKFGDYKMWNQVGEIHDSNQVELLAALITGKKRLDTLSDVERVLWTEIDGRYTHGNENGDVIPDIVVMSVENEQRVKDILASHPNFEVLVQSLNATFAEIVGILKRYSHEVLRETLIYCASMEILRVRMMTVHDEVDGGKLTLPEKPKKSKLGMYLIVD